MKKLLLAAAFLVGSMVNAFATCTGPAVMHDFNNTSFNMSLGANPTDGNCVSNMPAAKPVTPIAAAASDNHLTLVNGSGAAMSVHVSNNSATKNYLRLYDAGTGFNGCNSATGVIFAMEIPPNDSGFTVSLGGGLGISFANGLSWCITSGFGLTDTTNATASAILANASYR
jgi:hypothetical protein